MPDMERVESPSAEPEPTAKPEISEGIVKSELSDDSSLSDIPSQPTPQDPGEEAGDGESKEMETQNLERLCTTNKLDVLEAGVSIATNILGQLRDTLSDYENADVDTWIKSITNLEKQVAPARTVVGVVGNTGAGKSSVINALLDEERLLPTNCLRACTASATEISFNFSDNPQERYRAEVEFISAEEWTRELQVMLSDLLDRNGQISREATNMDTEAGIAYAKIKAVYPQKTRDDIAQTKPEGFANEPAVRDILGTTKVLMEETAKQLYQNMQRYVDSKEKSTAPVGQRKKNDTPMEYWPLIKVVRIFTKADALSTGAVIVDLPGVQDSNAARAAVAANYMKSCTGLWIVAPITRAVDDKTAKTLLGDSFKRQLKYDGTYSAVSFICSKTDDLLITEAAESLGLEAEIAESWDTAEKMTATIASLQSRIFSLKEAKTTLALEFEECETTTDQWEDLQSQVSGGKIVYPPLVNSKKRRRNQEPSGEQRDPNADGWATSSSGLSDKENSKSGRGCKPLTKEEVEEQLSSLRAQRKKIRGDGKSLDSEIIKTREEIEELQASREIVLAEVKAICIQGRNEYSRGAIKHDFAMGIKELDQENSEENDATFDPDQDVRDYDEVARSLPVFCVSSRAYQKLSGKLEQDDFKSHGFLSTEDTEIPELQNHAKKLTEAGRTNHCRRFLNDVSQLVNSMKLWSADDNTGPHLTDEGKRQEEQHLKKLLSHLEEELESCLKELITLIQKSLEEQIFDNINASMPSAIETAPDTAYSWGAPRSEGGLFWATYKATVRRLGVFSGASGPRNFNQDLFDPISRRLATGWERAFQYRIPTLLRNFANEVMLRVRQFHEAAKARAEQRHINVTPNNFLIGMVTLSSQILSHERTIRSLPEAIGDTVTEIQRDASRLFTPAICNAMTDAYTICENESGQGSYARMKEAMINHVENARNYMFHDAERIVKKRLEAMCQAIMKSYSIWRGYVPPPNDAGLLVYGKLLCLIAEQEIGKSIEVVYDTIFMDYMRTLVGTEADGSKRMSRRELEMRRHVYKLLLRGDRMFAPMLQEPATAEETKDVGDPVIRADELIQAHILEQDSV